jgi:NADH-quinone oxidoreductase subunit H
VTGLSWWTTGLTAVVIAIVKAIVLLLALVVGAAMLIWGERRLLALWQDRYGPNRVGPFGLLQVSADMIKIFFKEDWVPPSWTSRYSCSRPPIAMSTAMLAFLIVPVAPGWGVAPGLNVGVLLFSRSPSLEVYGAMLGGWSSNSKYALLGGCARPRKCSPTKCSWASR